MADLFYKTTLRVTGPWLIDEKQLRELDSIFSQQLEKLSAYRDKKISREVEEKLPQKIEYSYPKPSSKKEIEEIRQALTKDVASDYGNGNSGQRVVMLLSGDRKLVVNSLSEAFQHAGITDASVIGFHVSMQVADIEAELEFDRRFDKVSLHVTPETSQESRNTFSSLRDWVINCQPAKWQQYWGILIPLLWMLWLGGFVFGSYTYAAFNHNPAYSPYQSKAVELLENGITATNQLEAIETSLALQAGYKKRPETITIPRWWYATFFLGLSACVLFSVKPGSHLAIGVGRNRVKFWRVWIRILTVVIPGFVFSSFLSPALVSLLRRFF